MNKITRLFIPVTQDNHQFLFGLYVLASEYNFCQDTMDMVWAETKKKQFENFQKMLRNKKYMGFGYNPELDRNDPIYRIQFNSRITRNKFQDFQKETSNFEEIKKWIIENGKKVTPSLP